MRIIHWLHIFTCWRYIIFGAEYIELWYTIQWIGFTLSLCRDKCINTVPLWSTMVRVYSTAITTNSRILWMVTKKQNQRHRKIYFLLNKKGQNFKSLIIWWIHDLNWSHLHRIKAHLPQTNFIASRKMKSLAFIPKSVEDVTFLCRSIDVVSLSQQSLRWCFHCEHKEWATESMHQNI